MRSGVKRAPHHSRKRRLDRRRIVGRTVPGRAPNHRRRRDPGEIGVPAATGCRLNLFAVVPVTAVDRAGGRRPRIDRATTISWGRES